MRLRQGTPVTIPLGPFVDATDGKTPETALTIQKANVRLKKNGGNAAAASADQGASDAGAPHDEGGVYDGSLDATDLDTLGALRIDVQVAGALPYWREVEVIEAAVYDREVLGDDPAGVIFHGRAAGGASNSVTLPAAASSADDDYKDALVVYRPDSGPVQVRTALTGYSGSTTRVLPISPNWDQNPASDAGDIFILAAPPAATEATIAAAVSTQIDTDNPAVTLASGEDAAIADAVWDEAKAGHVAAGSMGEEIQSHALSSEISALNDLSAAEVNAEVDTALADYDGPTKAELDAGLAALNDPTAAAIADAVWEETLADHSGTAGSTAEALDASGGGITAAEIADAVWDEAKAAHVAAGSFGEEVQAHALSSEVAALNDISAAEVNAEVDQALADYDGPTAAELTAGLAGLNDPTVGEIADAVWDEAKAGHVAAGSMGEEVQAHALSSEVAALNDLSAAEVNAEVDTALADYDGPTHAELTAELGALNDLSAAEVNAEVDTAIADAALPTAAQVADAVWEEAIVDHSGTAGSAAQAVVSGFLRFAISNGTLTVYNADGTTAFTRTNLTREALDALVGAAP